MLKRQIKKNKKKKSKSKLVSRYIHTKGFSRLSGKSPRKKKKNFYVRNRIILVILLFLFAIPGLYFCFC